MNYQVLARRYRPRRFEEVVGQESIAATIRGAIQQGRVAHAYLFAGPRGVGKTSLARIFAKALNCPAASDRSRDRAEWGEPCDRCQVCEAIHLGQDIDVVELDGASHRGIDDVRAIIDGVSRPPTRSPFKIYIVDEVHMLTREAFNALLKTLEEPPAHVKFIFATTEAHRVPETVQSRCQRFDFHPIGEEAIARRLSQILANEGREAEAGLVEAIARYGKGGLRDAESLLDQLMTFSEGILKVEDLDRITGRIPGARLEELAAAVLGGDSRKTLEIVRACFANGADPAMILEQMVGAVRERIRAALGDSGDPSSRPSLDRLIGCLQILLDGAAKLKQSPFAEVSVEIILLKLSRLEDPRELGEVLRALLAIERKELGSPAPAASPTAVPAEVRAAPPPRTELEGAEAQAGEPHANASFDFARLKSLWDQIGVEFGAKCPNLGPVLRDVRVSPDPASAHSFLIECRSGFGCRQLQARPNAEVLAEVVREVTGAPWRFRAVVPGSVRAPSAEPPGKEAQGTGEAGSAAARRAQDPIVQKTLDLFGGRIVG